MLSPGDLDRLLDDCIEVNARLSAGARRTLRHFLLLRERHGARTNRYLSADDVELLEDWAAAEYSVRDEQPMASEPRTATADRRPHGYDGRDGAPTPKPDTVMRVAMTSRAPLPRPAPLAPKTENSHSGKRSGTGAARRKPSRASSIA